LWRQPLGKPGRASRKGGLGDRSDPRLVKLARILARRAATREVEATLERLFNQLIAEGFEPACPA